MCVCVCAWKRERERERVRKSGRLHPHEWAQVLQCVQYHSVAVCCSVMQPVFVDVAADAGGTCSDQPSVSSHAPLEVDKFSKSAHC